MDYKVAKNKRNANIALDGGECKVIFSENFLVFAIKAENEVFISLESGNKANDDGVMICPGGGSIVYAHMHRTNKCYITGSGNVQISAQNETFDPFNPEVKGGGESGGGGGEYTLPIASYLNLGGVKSGGDVTVGSDGRMEVEDNSHNHTISNITGLQAILDNKADISEIPTTLPANGGNANTVGGHTVGTDVPADAKFTDTKYTLPVASETVLGGVKSGGDITVDNLGNISVNDNSHNHIVANITDLDENLDSKLNTSAVVSAISSNSDDNTVPTSKAVYDYVEPLKSLLESFKTEHYAFTIKQNESNPASMVTYPVGCDNTNYAPAKMNYTTNTFDYGSWQNAFFIKNLKVVMLNYDGTEAYEIDRNDYSKKIDGTAVGTEGNVMIAFPKVYYKVVDNGNNTFTIHVSNRKLGDNYNCWAHIGHDGEEKDYCYMATYDGCYVDGKLRSLSGYAPMVGQTAQEDINRAIANNINSSDKNWYTGIVADRFLIQILLLLLGKNTDTQSIFGYGYANGNLTAISSGTMDTKGLFWGESTGHNGVKVFGIEHFWGNVWKRIAGWVCVNGAQKLKMTYGTQDGSTSIGYNIDGNGYMDAGTPLVDSVAAGYFKEMVFNKYGMLPNPTNLSGSASTHWCDYHWINSSITTYAFVGGDWTYGTSVGSFCVALYSPASSSYSTDGVSLSYKK